MPASSDHPVEPLHRHRSKVITPKDRRPWVQTYPDPRSVAWEEYLGFMARRQLLATPVIGSGVDFTLPLVAMRILLALRFNLTKPKGYPKRITAHTKRPDVDNYAKAVLDGLVKGRIIADDGLVTDLSVAKRYLEPGHPYGVEISLTALPAEV